MDDQIEDIENGFEDPDESGEQPSIPSKTGPAGMLSPKLIERLLFLWAKRPELDRCELEELYQIVASFLSRAGKYGKIKSLVDALPYDLDDYIADFVLLKLYESPDYTPLKHPNVLAIPYFYRFLIDQRRKERIPGIGTGRDDGEGIEEPDGLSLSEALGTSKGCHEIDPAEIFAKTLDDPKRVYALALEFLRDDCPVWVRLYLRLHDCADTDDGRMTRQQIAIDFGIPAYQQKAWKLGVVIPSEHRGDSEYFAEETLLGRWMRYTVGVDAEDPDIVLACVKILCQTALKHIDGQGELK